MMESECMKIEKVTLGVDLLRKIYEKWVGGDDEDVVVLFAFQFFSSPRITTLHSSIRIFASMFQ
jgi:hypothetical protein